MVKYVVLRLTHYGKKDNSFWYEKTESNKRGNAGIGNMLFQIAAAKSYAYDHDDILYVPDLKDWENKENTDKNKSIFRNCNHNPDFPGNLPIISRDTDCCNAEFPHCEHSFQVIGYFERKDNFYKNIDMILDFFKPLQEDIDKIVSKYPFILDKNLCSLHIRRGRDYIEIFGEEFMGKLNQYYLKAINYMRKEKNITNFIVFTNDFDFSKNFLNINVKDVTIHYSNERDYEEIWMMSLVKNNIVSHSTFSIWGAYLNKNPDAFVVCPEIRRHFYSLPSWHII